LLQNFSLSTILCKHHRPINRDIAELRFHTCSQHFGNRNPAHLVTFLPNTHIAWLNKRWPHGELPIAKKLHTLHPYSRRPDQDKSHPYPTPSSQGLNTKLTSRLDAGTFTWRPRFVNIANFPAQAKSVSKPFSIAERNTDGPGNFNELMVRVNQPLLLELFR